jgi:TM2 domain-containing membrane protein YozV
MAGFWQVFGRFWRTIGCLLVAFGAVSSPIVSLFQLDNIPDTLEQLRIPLSGPTTHENHEPKNVILQLFSICQYSRADRG